MNLHKLCCGKLFLIRQLKVHELCSEKRVKVTKKAINVDKTSINSSKH